jgi:hypothetical protein
MITGRVTQTRKAMSAVQARYSGKASGLPSINPTTFW